MITNADIWVFNEHIGSDRREALIATKIEGVSWVETQSMMQGKERSAQASYQVRIPIGAKIQSGREYVTSDIYASLTEEERLKHWTLQQSMTLLMKVTSSNATEFDENEEYQYPDIQTAGSKVVTVSDYSDNTDRGSKLVKHWRIGGV